MSKALIVAMAATFAWAPVNAASALPLATQAKPIVSEQTILVAGQRKQLSQAEIRKAYTGRTATSRHHSTTYKANGTWTNKQGQKGRYKITKGGLLVMSGDINISLKVFRDGSGYYHQNARTGEGGHYSVR